MLQVVVFIFCVHRLISVVLGPFISDFFQKKLFFPLKKSLFSLLCVCLGFLEK